MKEFRTTGPCIAEKHYMVDISDRISRIRKMVDDGQYFTINRARQYGKTTTLTALARSLREDYTVVSMDFQSFGADTFENADSFCRDFSVGFCTALEEGFNPNLIETGIKTLTAGLMDRAEDTSKSFRLFQLFSILKKICAASEKKIVLLIDEVDSASNNQVFLDFLAQLRDGYIARDTKGTAAFHSVILAGVTDIKNLKRKIRPEDHHKFNSPWNIAEEFSLDMSLSAEGIAGMLDDYENDHHTGMDTAEIAEEIYAWTSGYPFLVSRICQIVDNALAGARFPNLSRTWTIEGISEAARLILSENNTLFDSLMGKIYDNAPLRDMLQSILFAGERIPYNPDYVPAMDGEMYGFIKNDAGAMTVANRIFEVRIYNYFLSLRDIEKALSHAASIPTKNLEHK